MADKTSAEIFGFVLGQLSTIPKSEDRDRVVQEILKKSTEYDFTEDQMRAEEALHQLGFRRKS